MEWELLSMPIKPVEGYQCAMGRYDYGNTTNGDKIQTDTHISSSCSLLQFPGRVPSRSMHPSELRRLLNIVSQCKYSGR